MSRCPDRKVSHSHNTHCQSTALSHSNLPAVVADALLSAVNASTAMSNRSGNDLDNDPGRRLSGRSGMIQSVFYQRDLIELRQTVKTSRMDKEKITEYVEIRKRAKLSKSVASA